MTNINTARYWDTKWRTFHAGYREDAQRDVLYAATLGRLVPGQRVLDIGGGCSRFAHLARAAGHRVTVIDHSAWAMEKLRGEGFDTHVVDLATWNGEAVPGSYTVATCYEVLEHLDKPERAVACARAHADRAFFSVPCRYGFPDDREHLRVYTPFDLEDLLRAYWSMVTIEQHGHWLLAEVSTERSKEMPKISILTPSTGRETLQRTIDSVVAQTFKDWEMIIVFNNQQGREFVPVLHGAKNIYTVEVGLPKNYGGLARNEGFKVAQGKLIATLDDDDWWEPSFLWIMQREIQAREADLLYCRAGLWSKENRQLGSWFLPFDERMLPTANFILTPTILYRREWLERFKYGSDYCADWNFYLRMMRARAKLEGLGRQLANYVVPEPGVWNYWAAGGFTP